MGRITASHRLLTARRTAGTLYHSERPVTVLAEEPLEIRVDHAAYRTVFRTPGHDIELAHGLLLADGLIAAAEQVAEARFCAGSALSADTGTMQNSYNVLELDRRDLGVVTLPLGAPRRRDGAPESARTAGRDPGSCGVPTSDPLADLPAGLAADEAAPLATPDTLWALTAVLAGRPGKLAAAGAAAAALFPVGVSRPDAVPDPLVLREDIRAENAALAAVGWALQQERLPLSGHVLAVTGAPTLDTVRAAASAQVPVLLAEAAPTSLVLEAARRTGITLCSAESLAGDDARLTVWSAPGRIVLAASQS